VEIQAVGVHEPTDGDEETAIFFLDGIAYEESCEISSDSELVRNMYLMVMFSPLTVMDHNFI
jgi:hypothetical protein